MCTAWLGRRIMMIMILFLLFIYRLLSAGTNMCTTLRGKRMTSRLKEKEIPAMRLSQVRLGRRVQERKENNKRGKRA